MNVMINRKKYYFCVFLKVLIANIAKSLRETRNVEKGMMATGRRAALTNDSQNPSQNDPGRELFEACRNGDLNKVKKLVTSSNVNAKDTAGRKSTPLHFAAGL
jgi:hypothetical protein